MTRADELALYLGLTPEKHPDAFSDLRALEPMFPLWERGLTAPNFMLGDTYQTCALPDPYDLNNAAWMPYIFGSKLQGLTILYRGDLFRVSMADARFLREHEELPIATMELLRTYYVNHPAPITWTITNNGAIRTGRCGLFRFRITKTGITYRVDAHYNGRFPHSALRKYNLQAAYSYCEVLRESIRRCL